MKKICLLVIALGLPLLARQVRAQCSEIGLPAVTDSTAVVAEIPMAGVSHKFYFHGTNPGIQDEIITMTVRKVSAPDDWRFQICQGLNWCAPMLPWMSEISATDTLISEGTLEYDVEAFAFSYGSCELELTITREFCPELPVVQTLVFTLTDEISVATRPSAIELGKAWPNPFNPVTHIPFTLGLPGQVRVEVRDLAGRLVETLLNGTLPAGTHETFFDASGLPSATYLVQVVTETGRQSAPVTLIK